MTYAALPAVLWQLIATSRTGSDRTAERIWLCQVDETKRLKRISQDQSATHFYCLRVEFNSELRVSRVEPSRLTFIAKLNIREKHIIIQLQNRYHLVLLSKT